MEDELTAYMRLHLKPALLMLSLTPPNFSLKMAPDSQLALASLALDLSMFAPAPEAYEERIFSVRVNGVTHFLRSVTLPLAKVVSGLKYI